MKREDIDIFSTSPIGIDVLPEALNQFLLSVKGEQKIVFGSALPDLSAGRVPNDYDVYIHSPEHVERAKRFFNALEGCSQSEYMELLESRDSLIHGESFPLSIEVNVRRIESNNLVGEYIDVIGVFWPQNGAPIKLDIKIGSEKVDLEDFLAWKPSPVLSYGIEVTEGGMRHAAHRLFLEDFKNNVMRFNSSRHPHLLEKAHSRGMGVLDLAKNR